MDNTNNSQPKKEYSEQELDRLRIQWVLGKNRDIDTPLNANDLAALLNAGRVHWIVLNEEEKNMLRQNPEFSAGIESWRLMDLNNKGERKENRIKQGVLLVVEGLRLLIDKEVHNFFSDVEWAGFSKDKQRNLVDVYFEHVYGITPWNMSVMLGGKDA